MIRRTILAGLAAALPTSAFAHGGHLANSPVIPTGSGSQPLPVPRSSPASSPSKTRSRKKPKTRLKPVRKTTRLPEKLLNERKTRTDDLRPWQPQQGCRKAICTAGGSLTARFPDWPVEYGYLEFANPVIHDGLNKLREAGCTRVLAVPGMLFAAGHAKNDIPSVLNTYQPCIRR